MRIKLQASRNAQRSVKDEKKVVKLVMASINHQLLIHFTFLWTATGSLYISLSALACSHCILLLLLLVGLPFPQIVVIFHVCFCEASTAIKIFASSNCWQCKRWLDYWAIRNYSSPNHQQRLHCCLLLATLIYFFLSLLSRAFMC